jgi:hypothetical protein
MLTRHWGTQILTNVLASERQQGADGAAITEMANQWHAGMIVSFRSPLEEGRLVVEGQDGYAPPTAFYLDFAVAAGSRASQVRQSFQELPFGSPRSNEIRRRQCGWGKSPIAVSITLLCDCDRTYRAPFRVPEEI